MEKRNVGTKEKSPKQDLTSAKNHEMSNVVVVVIQALHGSETTRQIYKGTSSMDCRERESHARGVYPTLYTSHTGTASVKQEVGADTSVIAIE